MIDSYLLNRLSDDRCRCYQLTRLWADKNELVEILDEIGSLTSLESLKLYNNNIVTVPKSIGNLQNLKIFTLTKNKITTLPSSIGNLTNLQTLLVNGNEIVDLPEEFEQLELSVFKIVKSKLSTKSLDILKTIDKGVINRRFERANKKYGKPKGWR
ncbi:leucine-rich repeat domain-containing protein [Candidatus Lokiarchaeum ossiferum]|uniref:leucine-rich repeat domain-containing protein n=1 Tax=Candidatus Lokiarchaeum ossiferum TaxID=2951803 RepID=UPI00352E1715